MMTLFRPDERPQNQHGTWAFIDAQGNRTITHPVLAIYPLNVRSPNNYHRSSTGTGCSHGSCRTQ